ncbi:hypothetical protein CRENPOLYSF1_50091 [Crenothrix polyspora]|uniref:Uncharacterized protein n=1 Tax=Crenothrix polyspora TaxID=360316 RepID=A0A1R4HCU3_9GAMM|nr:hypothetical protein CRENPOLYSF1_50091 [Crenothrix polyspora]
MIENGSFENLGWGSLRIQTNWDKRAGVKNNFFTGVIHG